MNLNSACNLDEASFWRRLPKLAKDKPVVLYGMGNGADKLLCQLAKMAIEPAGIFASDEFVRGQSYANMKVLTYGAAKARFGEMLILICFGSEQPEVLQNMYRIAAEQQVYAPHLPLFGAGLFNEEFAAQYYNELQEAAAVWADRESRRVYGDYLRYLWTGRISYLRQVTSPREDAWGRLSLSHEECYLDLGAYDGDTVRYFCQMTRGKWQQIWALEPDPKNFIKLQKGLADIPNCCALQVAAGGSSELRLFADKAGRSSALWFPEDLLNTKTTKLTKLPTMNLDDLLREQLGTPPTLIKLDVEGAEEEVLCGAAKLLAEYKPKLILAAYHRTEDIFRLPLLLKRLNPEYRLYLRHHPYVPGWETNIYAI